MVKIAPEGREIFLDVFFSIFRKQIKKHCWKLSAVQVRFLASYDRFRVIDDSLKRSGGRQNLFCVQFRTRPPTLTRNDFRISKLIVLRGVCDSMCFSRQSQAPSSAFLMNSSMSAFIRPSPVHLVSA